MQVFDLHLHAHTQYLSLIALIGFMANIIKLSRLEDVPASDIMSWLVEQNCHAFRRHFTITRSEIEANQHWIGLRIHEVKLDENFILYNIKAHITLVKLDESTKTSVDLRDVKDLVEWHFQQLRLQYEMQICILPISRFDPAVEYQCRDLCASSPFFPSFANSQIVYRDRV